MTKLRVLGVVLNILFVVAYPVLVWWALSHGSARTVSALILLLLVPGLAFRFRRADRATFWSIVRLPIAMLCLLILGAATNDARFVLALPVLINMVLLLEFGSTLRPGATPMIERFARMQEPDLDAAKQKHCRKWTLLWCVFFVLNGTTAALMAFFASTFFWAAYTGGVAYALMGLMFAAEWIERRVRFGRSGT